jgi:hypothetical protein
MSTTGFSLWVKRPESEADNSSPSSAKVNNSRAALLLPIRVLHVALNYLSIGPSLPFTIKRVDLKGEEA